MPQLKTAAIVVRRADYRENDRMLTLFSPTLGRVEALCRGCRRQKSPLKTASELFCTGEYVLYQNGEHAVVSSCSVQELYFGLREDYDRFAHASYALELCSAAVQPDQENARLFYLLQQCLAHYCYGSEPPRRITVIFLMGLSSLLGFRPQVGRCVRCGETVMPEEKDRDSFCAAFSPEEGGVLCGSCASGAKVRLTGAELLFLRDIMKRGLAALDGGWECPDDLFEGLRMMAESRMESAIRSGKLLV